jgi:aryl-alcohol dehydrogenase-like predicted oxidoreductase
MQFVYLESIKRQISVLGFGCSGIMGRVGERDSIRALDKAWDLGINFFDTARSYGYGESERVVGQFLRTKRDQAVVATKFGIVPAPQSFFKRIAKPIVRRAISIVPSSRQLIRRQVDAQFTGGVFSVPALKTSFEESLRKLRTDYVDILYLHSAPSSVLVNDELFEELDKLKSSGKVRAIGFSSEPEVCAEVRRRGAQVVNVFQFPCNLFNLGSVLESLGQSKDGAVLVGNNPFGGTQRVGETKSYLSSLLDTSSIPPSLRGKLTPMSSQAMADIVLNSILSYPGIHAVIPAMMRIPHLETNVQVVARSKFSPEELSWIRSRLTTLMPA